MWQPLFLILILFNANAQADTLPPYKKFPSYPPVRLLLPDSASYYTKDMLPKRSPVMLMIFNPQCDHCILETEDIIKNISRFRGVQIVMSTSQDHQSMMAFRERFNLAAYNNIVIGCDPGFFLNTFFRLHNLPFLAFYNRDKELISVFEGGLPAEKMLEELKK